MAELLVRGVDNTHADPEISEKRCWKQGYPIKVVEDGHAWRKMIKPPNFAIIKIPEVSESKLEKYIVPYLTGPENNIYRQRLWKIRWADLPQAAKDRLKNDGELVIKAGAYAGTYDYTWTQVKSFFRNQLTNLDEVEDL